MYVGGDLYVRDDITYDQVTGREINISGVSSFAGISTVDSQGVRVAGVITATSFHGDGSNLTGVTTSLTGSIGIHSGGSVVGVGITILNVVGTGMTASASGSTGNVYLPAPGVSLGLAIALGG